MMTKKDESHEEHEDEGHEDHQNEKTTHTTVLASYSYTCSNISKLTSLDVNVFAIWPGFEELDVQLIGPGGQTLAELNADQTVISIEDVK